MQRFLIPLAGAAAAALAFAPSAVWAQGPSDADRYGWGPGMMWWGGGWQSMIFGPLFMIFVLAVVVAVVVLVVRWLGSSGQAAVPPHQSLPGRGPLDILRERFARGEIDKDEFEERRRVLGE
jgi:putative membrane protein